MRTSDEEDLDWQPTSRSARWYEWLLILLLFGLAGGARAGSVYKCINAQGDVAYQAQPCSSEQQTSVVEIAPAPAFAPSPQYAIGHEDTGRPARTATRARSGERREAAPVSYECRAADGQVFYRHGSCPHSIPAVDGYSSGNTASHGKRGGRSSGGTVSVNSQRISREDACHEIRRAGAAGRAGHEHDEIISSYEHNLGRDPCR